MSIEHVQLVDGNQYLTGKGLEREQMIPLYLLSKCLKSDLNEL